MKLLRDSILVRAMRRLLAVRRDAVRRPYTVTVPAPRVPAVGNVVELRPRLRTEEPRHAPPKPTHRAGLPLTQAAGR